MDIKITNSQIMELSWKLESIYLKLGSKKVLKLQKCNTSCDINLEMWRFVATLPLGSWPKQGLVKVWAKCEGHDSHFLLPGVWESVRNEVSS
jgi:hypothetical protein